MGLTEYQKKRDFRRTREPAGTSPPANDEAMFVVQRHAARRLHYDFRLQLDGVLKSWAVPKGPSLDPSVKSLAVEVEDHPVEYGSFEGVIPQGEYGGGTVMLFDLGRWKPLGDARKGLGAGKLKFRLEGQRLLGEWVLVRSARRRDGGPAQWLLIKRDDDQARPDDAHAYVAQFEQSVASGRSMEQIAADADRVWSAGSGEQKAPTVGHSPPPGRKQGTEAGLDPAELPGARRRPMPDLVEPQLAAPVDRPPDGDRWLHELKFDGYRLIAVKSGDEVRLATRRGNLWTERFPTVAEAIGRLSAGHLVLDGEVVIVAPDGTTDFQALQNSLRQGRFRNHVYFAFDVLYCDGYDLTPCPLEARKQFLASLLAARRSDDQTLRYSDHVRGQGAEMYQHACQFALEGVVSKRAEGRYRSGRTPDWRKSKCLKRQEFVVVGFTRPQGARHHFGALLLGYYDQQRRLIYSGRVGTGFTEESLAELAEQLRRRQTGDRPLDGMPSGASTRGVTWVRPELVAEVEFAQWTDDGIVRHASFQGLREDKAPLDVGREQPTAETGSTETNTGKGDARGRPASAASEPPARKANSRRPHNRTARVAGVRLSHPDKILFPDQNLSKIELAGYYEQVAAWILPHLADRPLSLVRCPEGRSGKCFYQKHVTESLPEPIRGIEVQKDSGGEHYVAIDDVEGLVTLVQLSVLEVHPWGSRADRIERPDRLVIDLDPGPGAGWAAVVESAHLLREVLARVDLASFARTTGGKGLHVVVPLVRRNDWPAVKQFAQTIANRLARRWPGHYVATSSLAKRPGKIYVDYLRNQRGATAIASYSTRARTNAPVATPLRWDEVTPDLQPDAYHVRSVPKRLAALPDDPWAELFTTRQWLTASRQASVAR